MIFFFSFNNSISGLGQNKMLYISILPTCADVKWLEESSHLMAVGEGG